MQKQLNKQDSETLAFLIEALKPTLQLIDVDYLDLATKELRNKASIYDAAAVLNRSYMPIKGNIMLEQVNAMKHLSSFVKSLKRIDELKGEVRDQQNTFDQLQRMFE